MWSFRHHSHRLGRRYAVLFVCAVLVASVHAQARGPIWKPERVPGSARLAWSAIDDLVLPEERGAILDAAARDFVTVAAARGYALKRVSGEGSPSKNSLVLESGGDPAELGDGFIWQRRGSRLFLRAANEAGWVNGLYALMAEAFGARWYWPGALGRELVGKAQRHVPEGWRREQPDFVQRTLYPVASDYGRRNRLNRKYQFNHNLARIFDAEAYAAHPEAFARINGRRREPRGSCKTDPQPDFTSPVAVQLAAEAARDHFDAHPEATSFSLAINDNALFDTTAATEAQVSPLTYFRGLPNYSDLVFNFTNRVAAAVFADPGYSETASGEPRYLGALAYYWTEQSPRFALHPRVMPVLTSDRAQWQDPSFQAADRALIRRWAERGVDRLATWDYYFGAPYPYPRQFNQHIAASIPFLKEQGVSVFFSQLPSVWGLDGPKAWLTAQLLWDADADADALLDEFYAEFFGAAGPEIRAFYNQAEAQREAQAGSAKWIKFYKDEAGIELFQPSILRIMRSHLDAAGRLVADDPPRRERVAVVAAAFAFTEAYSAFHRARRVLVEESLQVLVRGDMEREALLAAWRDWQAKREALREIRESLDGQSLHAALDSFHQLMQSDPAALALAALPDSVAELELPDNAVAAHTALRELRAGHLRAVPLLLNPGLTWDGQALRNFLGPEIPQIKSWSIQYRPSEGLRLGTARGGGGAGLRIENADIVAVSQTAAVAEQTPYLLEIDAGWRVSPDNRTRVQLIWEDIAGKRLRTEIVLRLPTGTDPRSAGLRFALSSPERAHELKIGIVANRQYAGDFLELRRVELSAIATKPGS